MTLTKDEQLVLDFLRAHPEEQFLALDIGRALYHGTFDSLCPRSKLGRSWACSQLRTLHKQQLVKRQPGGRMVVYWSAS